MTDKADHKNLSSRMSRSWLIFISLLLMSFFAMFFGRWIVFEVVVTPLVLLVTFFSGGVAIHNLVKRYPQTPWMLTAVLLALLLLFACSFLIFFFAFPPTKTCHLESLTIAECEDDYERFGNSVPEPAPCSWKQTHILGLILIGEETEKQCLSSP